MERCFLAGWGVLELSGRRRETVIGEKDTAQIRKHRNNLVMDI